MSGSVFSTTTNCSSAPVRPDMRTGNICMYWTCCMPNIRRSAVRKWFIAVGCCVLTTRKRWSASIFAQRVPGPALMSYVPPSRDTA